ncbi:hypothetical protein UlMin_027293 [Ulmus minor]
MNLLCSLKLVVYQNGIVPCQKSYTPWNIIIHDDIIIASNNELVVQSLKSSLDAKFMLKDLGPLNFFLGLEVARTGRGISVSQRPYVLQILANTGYLGCKPAATLMEVNLKLNQDDGELFSYLSLYRRLIVLQYVKGTPGQGLFFPSSSHVQLRAFAKANLPVSLDVQLKVFTDADWASCLDTRRIVFGFCVF